MQLTLTDVTTVRDRGALDSATVAGAVTDKQIEAAIAAAYHTMTVEACGYALYAGVRDLSDSDLANTTPDATTLRTDAEKKNDFIDAESYFALMHLESVVQIGKISETGTPMSMQTGREVRTFAPQDEITNTAQRWQDMAYTCLKPYLTLLGKDTDDNPTFVANKKRSMIFTMV